MRYSIIKKKSTKPERIIYEILKELNVPFKHRWFLKGREVDFVLIGTNYILEVDGHLQSNSLKNEMLVKEGYTPIHIRNQDIYQKRYKLKKFIRELYGY